MEEIETGVMIYSTTFNVTSVMVTLAIGALLAYVYDRWSRRPGH